MCCIIDCKLYDLVLKFCGFRREKPQQIKKKKQSAILILFPFRSLFLLAFSRSTFQFKMFLKKWFVFPRFSNPNFYPFLAFSIENRSTLQLFVVIHTYYTIYIRYNMVWLQALKFGLCSRKNHAHGPMVRFGSQLSLSTSSSSHSSSSSFLYT